MTPPITISRPSSLGLGDFPHIFMPPKATPVDRGGFATIAPGASFLLDPNGQNQIIMPMSQKGYLTQLAVYMGTYGSGQTWSLTQSGVAIRDYTNRKANLGSIETPVARAIDLQPQQPIALTFKNGGATPLSVQWLLYGWYYPLNR